MNFFIIIYSIKNMIIIKIIIIRLKSIKNFKKNIRKRNHKIFYTFQSYYYDFDYYHIYDNIDYYEEIHTNYYDFLLGNLYFDYSPFSLINNLDETDAIMDETGEFNYFLDSNEFINRQNDDGIKDILYGHDLFFDYLIFESLGFNGLLLDEDFQYIVNVSDLFIFFSSGILKFQEIVIYLFKYVLFYFSILKSIILNIKYLKFFYIFKVLVKILFSPFYIIIFIYIYIIYIICICINILFLVITNLNLIYKFSLQFNINLLSYFIFYFNFIIIYFFFFFKNLFYKFFFIFIDYLKQFKINFFLLNFKNLVNFLFKLLNIFFFFFFRFLILYLFFIIFFLNYDNIYIFFEQLFFISIDVRSFSIIYMILFFILIIFLFNPFTQLGNLIWTIRYEILSLGLWFWWLSGYINSIDIFLIYFWSNVHLLLNLNNFDFFLTFYESIINPWNQGLPELQTKFFDFWYDWIIENKNEMEELIDSLDFFEISPIIYKYTLICYKVLLRESFIIYQFLNTKINFFSYEFNTRYIYYFSDTRINLKILFFPFFISFRILNELCTGDSYYFINLFKDFFFFRYQGLAEGNLLYYKLYYKLNNFEYIEFLKNNLNLFYIDIWGGYKPKNSHLINFYYRNEYVYTEGNTEGFLEGYDADRALVGYVDPGRFIDLQYRPNKWWAKKPEYVNDFLRYTKFHHLRYKQYKYTAYTPWRFYHQDYSAYFNSILLPDLAFLGGSQWFFDPDLFQYTHTIKNDGIIFLGGRYISSEYEY